MGYFQRYGSIKPGGLIQLDPEHPFTQGLIACILFNEGMGIPRVLLGPSATVVQPNQVMNASGGFPATWISSQEGFGQRFVTNQTYWMSNGTTGSGSDIWIPTTAATVCIIRRKTDSTNRAVAMIGVNNSAHDNREFTIYCPYSNGSVLFDFGGTASPNRLTVAGLSFSTVVPERLILHAGPSGSAMWQNGIKVGSQSTAITRNGATVSSAFEINGPFSGDNQEFYYLAFYNSQWPDNLCQWWSASPYENLYSETFGNKFFFLGALSSDVTGTLTETISLVGLTGVGSYQDNQSNTQIQPPGNITLPIHQFERV